MVKTMNTDLSAQLSQWAQFGKRTSSAIFKPNCVHWLDSSRFSSPLQHFLISTMRIEILFSKWFDLHSEHVQYILNFHVNIVNKLCLLFHRNICFCNNITMYWIATARIQWKYEWESYFVLYDDYFEWIIRWRVK